ncbi:Male-specific lethal 2-like protein [Gryllus bimaculatus]|nr:Male-specific lethal 2-like protein [Gryllus bimaculatus]
MLIRMDGPSTYDKCYKKLCEYVTSTAIYRSLLVTAAASANNCSAIDGTSSLTELIQEGAGFKDDFKSNAGLSKSAYSILPCVYTSTSTQTQTALATASLGTSDNSNVSPNDSQAIRTVSNGASLYSVMYAGNGNKITIKRKANDIEADVDGNPCTADGTLPMVNSGSFKKPSQRVPLFKSTGSSNCSSGGKTNTGTGNKRKGCRCGNATPTPGKLTCCGQRCPCYVESKACVECRCRGCRNPHRPGGHKVRPLIPELQNLQLQLASAGSSSDAPLTRLEPQQTLNSLANSTVQVLGVYTQLGSVTSSLPTALLMGDEHMPSTESSDDTSDVEIDI